MDYATILVSAVMCVQVTTRPSNATCNKSTVRRMSRSNILKAPEMFMQGTSVAPNERFEIAHIIKVNRVADADAKAPR